MILRSTIFKAIGGDTVQARQTALLLADHGYQVDLRLTTETINYADYGLLHFFNIGRPADILYHIRKTKIPFVVSTILTNYGEYDRHHRKGLSGKVFRHFHSDRIEYFKTIARWVAGNDKLMSLPYLWKGQRKSVLEIMNKAALLLPNSDSEYGRLNKFCGGNVKCRIIPNGVDVDLFKYNKELEKDPKLVICVARIEGIKNQLNLIRALNNTTYRLVIIGAPSTNQNEYYRTCRSLAAQNVTFAGHLSQELLVDFYQRAKVHVLPSWFETTGLSSLEAAAMGCSVVITRKGDATEYFGDHAFYCDPSLPEDIYNAIQKAAAAPADENLTEKISKHYSWQQASLCTAEGYKKIVGKSWD